MWKIHYAWSRNGSSSSEIEYFEDEKKFEERLFQLLLESMEEGQRGHKVWRYVRWNSLRRWLKDEKKPDRKITRIIFVGVFCDQKWVKLEAHVTPPELHITGGKRPNPILEIPKKRRRTLTKKSYV